MNAPKVIEELKRKYPDRNIVQFPGEIICEIEPTSDHPRYSKVIAVIDQSVQHFHLKTTETYTIIKGDLILTVEGKDHFIPDGPVKQNYVIRPGEHHSAKGEEAWVEVVSIPGWTPEDHILVE